MAPGVYADMPTQELGTVYHMLQISKLQDR